MNGKYLKFIKQNRKKIGVSVVILIFLIALGITILHTKQPKPPITPLNNTVYVAGDGSGDFNCDGTADQVEINKALQFVAKNSGYTKVHLKGPFTYTINDTIYVESNITLEGDSDAVVKLVDSAGWTNDPMIPLIGQKSPVTNITIKGFEINGNYEGNTGTLRGRGYYNMIYFNNARNIAVHDMCMHDGHGDGLRISNGENIQFYNNKIYELGHDGLYAIESKKVEAWNNDITCRTNSALRVWNSNHIKFHDNLIDSHLDAGPGIQVQRSDGVINDIEIYNNTIHDTYGPGIWLIGYGSSDSKENAQNVHIHHNIFYNTGSNPSIDWVGGIVTSGFYDTLVENNVFDEVYQAAVVHMYPKNKSVDLSPSGTGYKTIVRNNIIVNTRERKEDPEGTGYGIINYIPESHTFVLQNNCFYDNKAGDFKNIESTSDINSNPLFADQRNHDYHLKSTVGRWNGKIWVKDRVSSPCIDAGYPLSNYSNELEPNGERINIGRYGNTEYASMSGVTPEYIFWKNQLISPELNTLRTLLKIIVLFWQEGKWVISNYCAIIFCV
jgi:hypothetical protein